MAAVGRAARLGRARRAAAAAAGAGRLGRRGGRAVRPQPVRQLGVLRHPRSRAEARACRRRGTADRATCWPRTASSSTRAGDCASRRDGPRRLPRAAHRAGPADGDARACAPPRSAAAPGSSGRGSRFDGQASHAGTTPMEMRRDAGLAAAEAALAIERIPASDERRRDHRRAAARARDPHRGRRRGDARRSTCATPRPSALAAMLEAARAARRGAAERRGCELAEEPSGGSSRSPSTPGWCSRRGAPASGRRRGGEPDQRRPPRRRRGRPRAARGDGLRPLDGRDQPRAARRTPPRPTWRSRSRRSPRLPPRPWRAARTCADPERPLCGIYLPCRKLTQAPRTQLQSAPPNPRSRVAGSGGPKGASEPGGESADQRP